MSGRGILKNLKGLNLIVSVGLKLKETQEEYEELKPNQPSIESWEVNFRSRVSSFIYKTPTLWKLPEKTHHQAYLVLFRVELNTYVFTQNEMTKTQFSCIVEQQQQIR